MTEPVSAYISESYGAVHTGDGTQLNVYLAAASTRVQDKVGPSLRGITDHDGDWLDQRFVAPGGMQRARSLLRTHSVVLLSGPPGSGRRAAALKLLHELANGTGGLYELPDTEDDSGSVLDAVEPNTGDRLLLDLSVVDETHYLSLQSRLLGFRAKLIERGARLAVVLPHRHAYLQGVDLKHYTAEITKPASRDVLSRYLQLDNIRPPTEEMAAHGMATYLARVPVREIAELSDRIRDLRDKGTPGGFPNWRDRAIKRVADRSAEVAADLATHHSGRRRALLLALAMFHESSPATVLHTAGALLAVLSHPPSDQPRLEQADLSRELTELGAETGPDGLVQFRTHNYDRGVRDHFWMYFPDLTEQLRRWIRDCLAWPGLGEDERGPVITRFAEQCLNSGRPDDLLWLAESWTGHHGHIRLIPDAAQVLVHGLAHEQYGQRFRQQIYDWSTTKTLPQNLKQVLVLVCSQAMRRSHPYQALVRLHHLDRRADGRVADTARTAVLGLAHSDDRMYRLLLQRVSPSLAEAGWARDFGLFLALTQSVPLVAARDVRTGLTEGWAAVFRRLPLEQWQPYALSWFAAVTDAPGPEQLLDVLVNACQNEAVLLGVLYQLALDWERSRPRRPGVTGLLIEKINLAQGLDHLVPAV
ncbi:hypothetical protein [Streptomyces sp. NPDC050485]|uniref:hypothetical protein n=1 Tax=Streptomyces sp. NPDC050485 TaxID=3365617 RepID=UPI0037AAE425